MKNSHPNEETSKNRSRIESRIPKSRASDLKKSPQKLKTLVVAFPVTQKYHLLSKNRVVEIMPHSYNNVQVVFASLPEERDVENSAAKEFALRAAEQFRAATDGDASCDVEIHHLADWNKDELLSCSSGSDEECNQKGISNVHLKKSVVIFLISCGPDGSVHRSVRKTTKWIKEQEQKGKQTQGNLHSDQEQSISVTAAIGLLGHAVCKTSAEQMEDEVYSSGRRLAKAIQRITDHSDSLGSASTSTVPSFLLETQVELESPEEKFDDWVSSWVNF